MSQNPQVRRAEEAAVKAMNRLPPGQSLTQKFPVLHYNTPAPVSLDKWTFRIFGLVEEEHCWDWAAFNQLPRTQVTLDLHCVTRWSKFDTTWEGVALKELVAANIIHIKPEAAYVIQHCDGDYTTNTPLSWLLEENMIMATHLDGQPIDFDHGYPLRMVIGSFVDRRENQSAYLWKGGKWLRGLEFVSQDRLGFWEEIGYHNIADPWQEQRIVGD